MVTAKVVLIAAITALDSCYQHISLVCGDAGDAELRGISRTEQIS